MTTNVIPLETRPEAFAARARSIAQDSSKVLLNQAMANNPDGVTLGQTVLRSIAMTVAAGRQAADCRTYGSKTASRCTEAKPTESQFRFMTLRACIELSA